MKKIETQRRRLMEAADKPIAHRLLLICRMPNILFLGLLIWPLTPEALSHSCFFPQAKKRAELAKENAEEISIDNPLDNYQHLSEEATQEVHEE
ncbi:hypothetical protein Nepgr_018926 [Nepenthes gracilis]|uniref:Uncharacterized protein n=1 Tax=Nepenthes gracilis TaxID=150966 RepID=A0AAD3XUR1_NEPGR|nr:hypothetical protein Nepgr_018926 [Nepenthes gracilis]